LSLGLEHLSSGDKDRARAVMARVAVIRIHRVGYTLTLRLSQAARALASWGRSLSAPSDEVLAGLLGARPFFPCVLEGGTDLRPFASRRDIAVVAQQLRRIGVSIALGEALGAPKPSRDRDPVALDAVVRSALLHSIIGNPFAAKPVAKGDVQTFLGVLKTGRVPDDARTRAANEVARALGKTPAQGGEDVLPPLLEHWLFGLEETLGGLDPSWDFDIRLLGLFVE